MPLFAPVTYEKIEEKEKENPIHLSYLITRETNTYNGNFFCHKTSIQSSIEAKQERERKKETIQSKTIIFSLKNFPQH